MAFPVKQPWHRCFFELLLEINNSNCKHMLDMSKPVSEMLSPIYSDQEAPQSGPCLPPGSPPVFPFQHPLPCSQNRNVSNAMIISYPPAIYSCSWLGTSRGLIPRIFSWDWPGGLVEREAPSLSA